MAWDGEDEVLRTCLTAQLMQFDLRATGARSCRRAHLKQRVGVGHGGDGASLAGPS